MAPIIMGLGLELIKQFAPKLIGVVAGDKGEAIAKEFVDMAELVTGESNPELMMEKLNSSHNHLERMKEMVDAREGELDALYLDDKRDARARDVKMRELGYVNTRADTMLVGAYIILAAIIVALAGFAVNQAVQGILAMLAGAMVKAITDAFQFEFGSSRGSKEKTLHMNSLGGGK